MNVSVIIPAFNAEQTIADCMQSVLSQKFDAGFEVIVVDDGSNDKSAEIVKGFKSVKLLQQKNKGPATARNLGAENAAGEIIVFIDSDCIAEKNWLREMVAPFRDANVVGVQGCYKTNQKELIARFTQIEIEQRYERMGKTRKLDWIGSYSAAYRKEIFLKEQGYDERFPIASGEDPELSFKLSKKGYKLVFNPNAVVYHNHQTSLFDYLKTKFFRAYWRVLLYRKHKDKMVRDSYTPQTLKIQIAAIALIVFSIGGLIINQNFFLLTLAVSIGVLLGSIIPFLIFAIKRDFLVGLSSLIILSLRSIFFLLGLIYGLVRGVWK